MAPNVLVGRALGEIGVLGAEGVVEPLRNPLSAEAQTDTSADIGERQRVLLFGRERDTGDALDKILVRARKAILVRHQLRAAAWPCFGPTPDVGSP